MSTKTYDAMISAMPAGLDRAILRVLSFHIGKERAIGRYELLAAVRMEGFDVNERVLRECIHGLRREGRLICSIPGEAGGYYLAASLEEFQEFRERELHAKAMDLLETESAMNKFAHQEFGEASQPQML
jgi:hypothetical protein